MPVYEKREASELNYVFDWSEWLGDGELITGFTLDADSGITVDAGSIVDIVDAGTTFTSAGVRVLVSGGTLDEQYGVRCEITTNFSPANVDERELEVLIIPRT